MLKNNYNQIHDSELIHCIELYRIQSLAYQREKDSAQEGIKKQLLEQKATYDKLWNEYQINQVNLDKKIIEAELQKLKKESADFLLAKLKEEIERLNALLFSLYKIIAIYNERISKRTEVIINEIKIAVENSHFSKDKFPEFHDSIEEYFNQYRKRKIDEDELLSLISNDAKNLDLNKGKSLEKSLSENEPLQELIAEQKKDKANLAAEEQEAANLERILLASSSPSVENKAISTPFTPESSEPEHSESKDTFSDEMLFDSFKPDSDTNSDEMLFDSFKPDSDTENETTNEAIKAEGFQQEEGQPTKKTDILQSEIYLNPQEGVPFHNDKQPILENEFEPGLTTQTKQEEMDNEPGAPENTSSREGLAGQYSAAKNDDVYLGEGQEIKADAQEPMALKNSEKKREPSKDNEGNFKSRSYIISFHSKNDSKFPTDKGKPGLDLDEDGPKKSPGLR